MEWGRQDSIHLCSAGTRVTHMLFKPFWIAVFAGAFWNILGDDVSAQQLAAPFPSAQAAPIRFEDYLLGEDSGLSVPSGDGSYPLLASRPLDFSVPPQPLAKDPAEEILQRYMSQDLNPEYQTFQWFSDQLQVLEFYPVSRQLTLAEALSTALQQSPEIEVLRIDVAVEEQNVLGQNAKFDWLNFLESSWDDRSDPVGSSLAGAQSRVRNDKYTGRAGFKRTNDRGGSFEVSQRIGHENSNSTFFSPRNQGSATLGVTMAQPLLRDGGRFVNRSSIEIAISDARLADAQYMQGLQNHLAAVANAYWSLIQDRAIARVYLRSWKRGDELVQLMRNRQSIDIGPTQLLRASSAATQRYNSYAVAQRQVLKSQEALLKLMYGAEYIQVAMIECVPVTPPGGDRPFDDNKVLVDTAVSRRPEVASALQSIRRAAVEQGVARNSLLPLLGLTLDVSNSGLRGNSDIGSAWTDQFSVGEPTYKVGLSYERPVGNRAAQAANQKAILRLRRFQEELESVVADVALDASTAAFEASSANVDWISKTNSLRLTIDEYDRIEKRFNLLVDGSEVGRLYLENILQTQDRLAGAEIGAITSHIQRERARVNIDRATGTILDFSGANSEHHRE